jgi:hypothetical protein
MYIFIGWNRNPNCQALGFTVGKMYSSKYLQGKSFGNCLDENVETMTLQKAPNTTPNIAGQNNNNEIIESIELEFDFLHRDINYEALR